MPPTLFLSYSHRDVATARTLSDALTSAGVPCWQDERWLRAGDDFAAEIVSAIRASHGLVLLLSPSGVASRHISNEVAIAHHLKKPIIPVLIEPCDISDALLPYIVRLHYHDLAKHTIAELVAFLQQKASTGSGSLPEAPASHAAGAVTGADATQPAPAVAAFVSIPEYREFICANRRHRSDPANFGENTSPVGDSHAPVTGVSWNEAQAYCDWAGGCLPGPPDRPNVTALTENSPAIREWRDAGTEWHKQVWDPRALCLAAMLSKDARPAGVGFRRVPSRPAPPSRFVEFDGGTLEVGTDVVRFNRIANAFNLSLAQRRPVLTRLPVKYELRRFALADSCVTNDDFFRFTRQTGTPWPPHWHASWIHRSGRPFPVRLSSLPVTHITAAQAQSYCFWSRTRLPTWIEWERAASGVDRRPYPWGDRYAEANCNSIESGCGSVVSVNDFATGNSFEGVQQMSGNVAEWVIGPNGRFETRGGSYRLPCELWGLTYVFRHVEPHICAPDVGFRVARDA